MIRQRAEEQAGTRQFCLIGRFTKELDCLLVSSPFFLFVASHEETLDGFVVLEQHSIVECILRVETMPERDMRQLMREDHRKTRLIRKHIDQTAAQYDGVSYGE